jgi:hypothetical protein
VIRRAVATRNGVIILLVLVGTGSAPSLGAQAPTQVLSGATTTDQLIEQAVVVQNDSGEAASLGPDRRVAVLRTRSANIASCSVTDTLWAVDLSTLAVSTTNVSSGIRKLGSWVSKSNDSPLTELRWLPDGHSVAFLAMDESGRRVLLRSDVKTAAVTSMGSAQGRTDAYDVTDTAIALKWSEAVKEPALPGYFLRQRTLLDLFLPEYSGDRHISVTLIKNGNTQTIPVGVATVGFESMPIWLSPTARYAVTLRRVARIEPSWRKFDAGFGPIVFSSSDEQIPDWLLEYVLIDFERGKASSLTNTPAGDPLAPLKVIWLDERTAIVSNVYPPVSDSDAHVPDSTIRPAIIELNVASGGWRKIADTPKSPLNSARRGPSERFTDVNWQAGKLIVSRSAGTNGELAPLVFARGRQWQQLAAHRRDDQSSRFGKLTYSQNLASPPRLLFTAKGRVRDVTGEFDGLSTQYQPAHVEEFSWKSASGRAWRGGLIFPLDFRQGKRFPLVIQTHGYDPTIFLARGPSSTVFAAQALAANNFFVLQMEDQFDTISTVAEAPTMAEAYEGAIATLSAQGLIDPQRVGLVGFSRTAFHVKYAISHARVPYRAAVTADGFDFGYFFYLNFFDRENGALRRDAERVNGGAPFGQNLQSWIERSPALASAKIQTPLLVQVMGPASLLYEWEMYAVLKLQDRPVELMYFPDGDHNLIKSCEQAASTAATVDWLNLWINGKEQLDPAKADQSWRWRKLISASDAQRRHDLE